MTLDDVLERWIPYRLQAIETLRFAWELTSNEAEQPRRLEVLVDGRVKLSGNVAAIANPMIEAGLIHARALLEFMGLCDLKGRLSQIRNRRKDDIAIELYSTAQAPLSMVSPDEVLRSYGGPPQEAEAALLAIFELANKGLAHLTFGPTDGKYTDQHIDIACRGLPVLLFNHLYAKLGRELPQAPSAAPNGG